jgi:hypothetical protein
LGLKNESQTVTKINFGFRFAGKEHVGLIRVVGLVWALITMLPGTASADERPGLAALNLKAQRGVDSDLAEMISEAALSILRTSRRFKSVIGSSDVADMISAEQRKQALGCDEDSCLAELGGALGVPYLLTGSLGSVGGRFMLNLKLLAVDEAKVAGRMTSLFEGERALVDGLKPALAALLKDAFGSRGPQRKAAAVATKAPAKAPSLQRTAKGPTNWKRWTAVGLGVLGAGLGAYSYTYVSDAQSAYNVAPSDSTSEELVAAADLSNTFLIGGLVSLGTGAGLWVWGP